MIKYIKADVIIGQTLVDFNIPKTDTVDRMYEWILNAIETMELEKYYTHQYSIIEVKEHRASLPCAISFLHSIWIKGDNNCICNNAKGLQKLTIRNNPLIGSLIKDNYSSNSSATVEGNFLKTSFTKGKVVVFYRGVPKDENGYPLVPDNAKLKEALPYYILYRLGLSGYKHPIISWNDAYLMWEKLYPSASNSIDWMDLTEYQEFTELWNNFLVGDLVNSLYIH